MSTTSDSLISRCNSITANAAAFVSGVFYALSFWFPSLLIKQTKRLITRYLLMPVLLFGLVFTVSSQEPFIHEPSPAPFDQSRLVDIAIDPVGRVVAVGWWIEVLIGGSPSFPLVIFKEQGSDLWEVLETPDFGFTWHRLYIVKFIPDTNGDFVAVGQYINLSSGSRNGMLLRYYRDNDLWELNSFNDPEQHFHFVRDFTFHPDDPNRLLIVGTRGKSFGLCHEFITMVVDYNLDGHTATFLPTTTRGNLRSIAAMPNGNFFSVGAAAGDCDYLPWPLLIEIGDGVEIVHQNPPPDTPGFWYDLTAVIEEQDGNFFMVGHEAPFGGSNFNTLAYRYHPLSQTYESFKPLDPDTIPNFLNQLWRIRHSPDGRIIAAGRTGYTLNNLHYWSAMVQSFDGENWQLHPLPDDFSAGIDSEIWSLAIHSTGQVYTAGSYREIDSFTRKTLILKTDEVIGVPQTDVAFRGVYIEMAGPNPFLSNTALRLYLDRATHVRIEVMDVYGKQIRLLTDQKMQEGWATIKWDGQDNQGQPASSGMYLFRLSSISQTAIIKLLKSN